MAVPSPAACEVLGCLAPFTASGPHQCHLVRRRTRLTEADFTKAVSELQRAGLVTVKGMEDLWLTAQGETIVAAMFG